jgi:putative nucleotidyltransferase with HDIG domain
MAAALDERDPAAGGHSRTVARYARVTAIQMGLGPEAADDLHLAGLLHDIGKLALPDEILCKSGSLTDEEWTEMREHPRVGAAIVEDAGLEDVCEWVLSHHERPDGRGYPHGLAGEEVSIEARILAVTDAYEAMTSDRVYRRAISRPAACVELRRCAGTQFDAIVVEAFLATAAAATAPQG